MDLFLLTELIIIPLLLLAALIFILKRQIKVENKFHLLFWSLFIFNAFGSLAGLYLNSLKYDIIDYYFATESIVIGSISSSFLLLAYYSKFRKQFLIIEFLLWLSVLVIKGGYCTGFHGCLPYPSIILFDLISTILRFLLYQKTFLKIKNIWVYIIPILIVLFKVLFLKFPIISSFTFTF